MLQLMQNKNGVKICVDGANFIEHSPDAAFATAVRHEKHYISDRGTVKVKTAEVERVPLTSFAAKGENELVFFAGTHSLSVHIEQHENGAMLHFNGESGWAYEFRVCADADEHVFGGGEQYKCVDLSGTKVVNFVSEHIKLTTLLKKSINPKMREKNAIGSYSPMPVFITDKGRLFMFTTSADGFSVFSENEYLFSFDSCPKKLFVAHANSFKESSALIASQVKNRQYIPDWCYDGMILAIQGGSETVLEKTFAMLDAGAQICGVWSQDWSGENITIMGKQVWWNWEADEKLYPDLKGTIDKLHSRGVRFLAYINPYLVKDGELYNFCRDKGYLITKQDGSIYHIKSTTFDAGMLDLTNPDAVRYTKDVLIKKNMLDLGVDGWMADFGEYLPVDCVLHSGEPAQLHNEWPVMWAKLNREAIEEYGKPDTMFFSRAGYLGIQEYAPIMWNGDQHTDFSKDYGMPCVMPASFSLGLSGVPMVHCDIGGFFSVGNLRRSEEQFIRWMEMCTFSLLMRSHEAIRPWANAQFDAPGVTPYTVRLTNIHKALKPYIEKCVHDAQNGIPALRPDFWDSMKYSHSHDEYSYLFGDDMFVCPVIENKVRQRRVYLPAGNWVNFWNGIEYRGGQDYVFPAPLGRLPVFYRKGSKFTELFRQTAAEYGNL